MSATEGDPTTAPDARCGPMADQVPVLRVVCVFCTPNHVIREGVEPISHGLCPEASDAMIAASFRSRR